MASFIRKFIWGGDPDVVNEISHLTLRDIYAVQKSWAVVYSDPLQNGLELFKRLFRADPETKTFFKAVAHLPENELSQSHKFKAHVINLMSSLNLAVTNLHQPEIVVVLMNKLGESHKKRNVQRKHFDVTKDVLIGMLKDLKLDAAVINSWDKFIDFIYEHIFTTLG